MFRLRVLGGFALEGLGGAPVLALPQRRAMAGYWPVPSFTRYDPDASAALARTEQFIARFPKFAARLGEDLLARA